MSVASPPSATDRPLSPARATLCRLTGHKLAMAGAAVVACLVVASIFAPWLTPYSYEAQDLAKGATAPSREHWLGTDPLGRDLLTRLLYGSRISLLVALCATTVSVTIGVLYGSISGYRGGRVDSAMMRVVDILYALPFTIFVILLMVLFGRHILLLFVAIGAVEWLTLARIVRGQVLVLKNQEFVAAAIVLGQSGRRILQLHLLPNLAGPVIVYTTLTIPNVMILEAFLSFLGLGVQAPMSSWGLLIAAGVESMEDYPWLLIFPSLALALTLFSFNFLGDGLRDALDPKRN